MKKHGESVDLALVVDPVNACAIALTLVVFVFIFVGAGQGVAN